MEASLKLIFCCLVTALTSKNRLFYYNLRFILVPQENVDLAQRVDSSAFWQQAQDFLCLGELSG